MVISTTENSVQFMKPLIAFFLFFLSSSIYAQLENDGRAVNLISNHLFGEYTEHSDEQNVRAVLKSKDSFFSKINPLRYTASGLLFVYQNVFSEQISSNCVYHISCSEMTKKSIESQGLVKGTFIGLHQLTNCSTSIYHDHEAFEVDENQKIINALPEND